MNIPPYRQEQPHTCAVACLRSVAAFFDIYCDEPHLAELCETTLDGTTPENLAHAAHKLGLAAVIAYDEPNVLAEAISNEFPVIVYLGLPQAHNNNVIEIHAVLVTALTGESVTYLDPVDGQNRTLPRDQFFAHWAEVYHVAILCNRPH